MRSIWKCPYCANEIRKGDRPKNRGGSSKKHCGCRIEKCADRSLPPILRYRPARLARLQREREDLGDAYIRKLLIGKPKPGQSSVEYPQALVDLKREVVQIERFIKKQKEAGNEKCN